MHLEIEYQLRQHEVVLSCICHALQTVARRWLCNHLSRGACLANTAVAVALSVVGCWLVVGGWWLFLDVVFIDFGSQHVQDVT